ncbi:hypothetical protein PRZ48_003901 [Zasmidium cellare]|uniref:Uncharacterized protein n=1 Tax=Zasmidium cellare TaxID=395010 RepID=A0ABR0EWD2_ZASCE|nr:hypothetical protein PRZ48_003901 [Zasmidium cellare]
MEHRDNSLPPPYYAEQPPPVQASSSSNVRYRTLPQPVTYTVSMTGKAFRSFSSPELPQVLESTHRAFDPSIPASSIRVLLYLIYNQEGTWLYIGGSGDPNMKIRYVRVVAEVPMNGNVRMSLERKQELMARIVTAVERYEGKKAKETEIDVVVREINAEDEHWVKRQLLSSSSPSQFIHDFLVETYNGYPEAAQTLVIITHRDWPRYNVTEALLGPEEAASRHSNVLTHGGGPMRVPSRPPWTEDFDSPFVHHTPEDVAKILREADGIPRHLFKDYCIIMDEQTWDDRTVLLVKSKRSLGERLPPGYDDSPIVNVRESFKEVNGIVQAVSVGQGSLAEILWNQQHTTA